MYGKSKRRLESRTVKLAEDGIEFIEENSDYDRKPLFLYADMKNTGDVVKKLEIANRILKEYPNCNLADDIQFKIARFYSVGGLNDFDKAILEYKKLITKYPKSLFVGPAETAIRGIDQKFDRDSGKLRGSVH